MVSSATTLRTKLAQVDEDQEADASGPEGRRVANFRDIKLIAAWGIEFQVMQSRCTCPRGCKQMLVDCVGFCTYCADFVPGIKSCNCPPGCCDDIVKVVSKSTEGQGSTPSPAAQ